MSAWILLEEHNGEGSVVELQFDPSKRIAIRGRKKFRFDLGPNEEADDELHTSAQESGEKAYRLLLDERCYLNGGVAVCFSLSEKSTSNIDGRSADLLFALVVLEACMEERAKRRGEPHNCHSFAATGVLEEVDGIVHVRPVKGIQAKLSEALKALPQDALVFYPAANQNDISPELKKDKRLQPVARLADAAQKLGIQISRIYLEKPYPGLMAFDYDQRSIFFGRETEIEKMCDRLLDQESKGRPGQLVLASSGRGKSSLVRAGVVPELECLSQDDQSKLYQRPIIWSIWYPGKVLENLNIGENIEEATLAQSILDSWTASLYAAPFAGLGGQTPTTLAELAKSLVACLPKKRPLLFVVDQCEEIFVFEDELVRSFAAFIEFLQNQGVWVVVTLSNAFMQDYEKFLQKVFPQEMIFMLEQVSPHTLEDIIREPAKRSGLTFTHHPENNALTLDKQLLQEALQGGVDSLPLLAFALEKLWDAGHEYSKMRYEDYIAKGGSLNDIIGNEADRLYDGLNLGGTDDALLRLLRALTRSRTDSGGDVEHAVTGQLEQVVTGQAASIARFPEGGDTMELIDALVKARLLIYENDKVRVSHMALLTHWPKAKKIIADISKDLQLRDKLIGEAEEWKVNTSLLLPTGKRLIDGEDLLERWPDELEAYPNVVDFINASVHAEKKRKTIKRLSIAGGIAAVILFIATAFYLVYSNGQVALSGQLIAEANSYLFKKDFAKAEIMAAKALIVTPSKDEENVKTMRDLLLKARAGGIKLVSNSLQKMPQATLSQFSRDGQLVATVVTDAQVSMPSSEKHDWLSSASKILEEAPNLFKNVGYAITSNNPSVTPSANQPGKPTAVVVSSSANGLEQWRIGLSPSESMPDSIAFSESDGKIRLLAIAHADHHVSIWSLQTGKAAMLLTEPTTEGGELWIGLPRNTHVQSLLDKPKELWTEFGAKKGSCNNPVVEYVGHGGHALSCSQEQSCKHTKRIPSMAFHPSKPWLVTSSEDQRLCLWDYSQQPAQLLWEQKDAHNTAVHGIAFNADGSLLASGGGDYLAKIWKTEDMAAGYDGQGSNPGHQIEPMKTMEGHSDSVFAVAFSPNGQWFASGGYDRVIRVWELDLKTNAKPETIRTLNGHEGTVMDLVFSGDSKTLVSGGKDLAARIWGVEEGRLLATFTPENGNVRSVAWQGFADNLNIGGEHGWSIWSLRGNQLIAKLWNGGATVGVVAFDPAGLFVAAAGDDGKVRIWDNDYSAPLELDSGDGKGINGLAISPDSQWLVAAGEGKIIHIWKHESNGKSWEKVMPAGGKPLTHDGAIWGLCFDAKGRWLFSSNTDNTKLIKRWNISDWSLMDESDPLVDSVYSLACDASGSRLVSGDSIGKVKVWDTEHLTVKSETGNVEHEEANVWSVALAFNPPYIFSGNSDGHVYRWLANDPEWTDEKKEEKLGTSDESAKVNPTINSVSFNKKRGWVAAGGDGGKVEIYDTALQHVQSLEGHDGTVWYVAFDPQGSRLAYGGLDRVLRIFNVDEIQHLASGAPGVLYQESQKMTGFSVVKKTEVADENHQDN